MTGIAQTGTGKTAAFTLPMLATLERLKNEGPGAQNQGLGHFADP